jgi:hypothetical protein
MPSTPRLHDDIAHAILQEAQLVFDYPLAVHPATRVFDADSDRRDRTIVRFLRWREFTTTRLSLGLDPRDPSARKPREPSILRETTPTGEGITHQICEAFLRRLALLGVAQEAHGTARIAHEEGFERVALGLATGVVLRFLWSGRAVAWSLRTIVPTRGGVGTPVVRSAASPTAKASAVRAGSSS